MTYFTKTLEESKLLIKMLPIVMEEKHFALHGGTALNFFIFDMPRLSVDIDLTYVPLEERDISVKKINTSLKRIREKIFKTNASFQIKHKPSTAKLFIRNHRGSEIKVEVNLTNRGTISQCIELPLSPKAQSLFSRTYSIPIVPEKQVFGGKICAALSRQNMRDLFDIHQLFNHVGINDEIKEGFLFLLLSSKYSFSRMLSPPIDRRVKPSIDGFRGMSQIPFSIQLHEKTLQHLISEINKALTPRDKKFLIDFKNGKPDWAVYDWKDYPGVQWKLSNIFKLKKDFVLHRRKLKELISVLNFSKESL